MTKSSPSIWHLLESINGEDFINFCGLLRKHELYKYVPIFCELPDKQKKPAMFCFVNIKFMVNWGMRGNCGSWYFMIFPFVVQVNNYEIVVNFFHISHNLTWYSAIVHKFTRIYPVCSTYELTKQFM